MASAPRSALPGTLRREVATLAWEAGAPTLTLRHGVTQAQFLALASVGAISLESDGSLWIVTMDTREVHRQ